MTLYLSGVRAAVYTQKPTVRTNLAERKIGYSWGFTIGRLARLDNKKYSDFFDFIERIKTGKYGDKLKNAIDNNGLKIEKLPILHILQTIDFTVISEEMAASCHMGRGRFDFSHLIKKKKEVRMELRNKKVDYSYKFILWKLSRLAPQTYKDFLVFIGLIKGGTFGDEYARVGNEFGLKIQKLPPLNVLRTINFKRVTKKIVDNSHLGGGIFDFTHLSKHQTASDSSPNIEV